MANKELQIDGGKFIDAEDIGNYIGNPNPVKLGRCIKELERIYGIHQGNGSNQYEQNPKLSDNAKTQQEELADMIGISVDTLNNYKKLTELVLIEKKKK